MHFEMPLQQKPKARQDKRNFKCHELANFNNWIIHFFIYLLSSYPHLLFLAFLQSFLEDKKGIKLGSKAIIFWLLFHEPQYNISICTLVFFKFMCLRSKRSFRSLFLAVWKNILLSFPDLFTTVSHEALGTSAKQVSKALEQDGSEREGKRVTVLQVQLQGDQRDKMLT